MSRMTLYFSSGSNENVFLSNFMRCRFSLKGFTWKSVEHYFQAMKFEGINEGNLNRIRNCSHAAEAKRLGRELGPIRGDWERVKLDVMREAIYQKFKQNPMTARHLLNTGDAELVENLPDEFWGRGKNGEGKNWTGKILMEVRAKLQEEGKGEAGEQ